MHLDHTLIAALVKRWRRKTHIFHLNISEMILILQDITMLTSISIDGAHVIGREGSIEKDALCGHLLKRVPPTSDYRAIA